MSETSESDLLQQVVQGDREALRTLLQRSGPNVRERVDREIGAVWRSLLDADDVMQVTYMEAFLQQSALRATSMQAFEAWLRRIAMNNLRDAVKELGRQKRPHPGKRVQGAVAQEDSYVSLIHVLSDGGDTPSRHVARDEAAAAIQSILKRMPPDYAQVIQLYDLDAFSANEVAEKMARSAGAVHMLARSSSRSDASHDWRRNRLFFPDRVSQRCKRRHPNGAACVLSAGNLLP